MRSLSFLFVPFHVTLNNTGNFRNGAFFLQPDENSEKTLREFMSYVHEHSPLPAQTQNNPHLTIARNLNNAHLKIAKEKIKNIDLRFTCDNLAIREFIPHVRQYEIIHRTDLNS